MNSGLQLRFIALVCLVVFTACGRGEKQHASSGDAAVPVTVAPVTTMDVPHCLNQTGSLFGNEEVLLRAEEKGTVSRICFDEGARVARGDVLVCLDDTKLRAEVHQLRARIGQYKIQLAHTQRTLARKRDLLKGEVISDQEFDDLETQQKIDSALIEQAEAALAIARERLADMQIRAPFDAVAGERLVAPGDYLSAGDPVVKVVQVAPVKVSVRVFEKFKGRIQVGMPVELRVDAFPEEVFHGTVYFVSPDVDRETRTFLVKARVPNTDMRLNPGMFANVSIEYERHTGACIVPWEAVVRLEDQAFVFAVEDAKARQVPVSIVTLLDDQAEVQGELKPGVQVIIDGKFTVRDGDRVTIAQDTL